MAGGEVDCFLIQMLSVSFGYPELNGDPPTKMLFSNAEVGISSIMCIMCIIGGLCRRFTICVSSAGCREVLLNLL